MQKLFNTVELPVGNSFVFYRVIVFAGFTIAASVLLSTGCSQTQSLDKDPEKVEERRQEYKKQSLREMEEG